MGKTPNSADARAAFKSAQATEGARAMKEYNERRRVALAKTARLRAQRLAREEALESQHDGPGKRSA